MKTLPRLLIVALSLALLASPSLAGTHTVTTSDGDGADAEVRQFDKDNAPGQDPQSDVNFGNAQFMGARASTKRGFNAAFIRFDLSAYVGETFVAPATLGMTKYRDEEVTHIGVWGLSEGVDNWIEGNGGTDNSPAGELTYLNAPGVIQDSVPLSGNDLDPAETTHLGSFHPAGDEGDVVTFSSSALLDFLNADTDGKVTLILSGADDAKGLDMFATKETTTLYSGAAIPLESGAPKLTFTTYEPPAPPEPADYGAIARAYAEAMVDHGRDTYGSEHSPLFAAQMTRPDYNVPEDPHGVFPAMDDYGLRYDDRAWGSANAHDHVQLYQQLQKMTDATGDGRYAQAADDAIKYTFDNCRSDATDLIAWGEEMSWMLHYDAARLRDDGIMDGTYDGRPYDNDLHEPGARWAPELWDKAFTLSPAGARAFAQGLWDHQISDQSTGDFSRHAKYSAHGPGDGESFPRVGSWMMLAWAKAYQHVDDTAFDTEMLDAIQTVASSYNNRRDGVTDVLPAGTSDRYKDVYWLTNNIGMANDIGQMLEMNLLPAATENLLRNLAVRTDHVILNLLDHNLDGHLNGVHPSFTQGFNYRAHSDILENGYLKLGDPRHSLDARSTFSDFWTAGYGAPTTSSIALSMAERHAHLAAVGDPNAAGYYDLVMTAADLYLDEDPDTTLALHPSALASAIQLMLKAYELDGDAKYLDRAAYFGDWAADLFFDETSDLPKVTSQHDFYEALTGGDGLALAMYDLSVAVPEPATVVVLALGATAALRRRRR